ncbi:MAG: hypothetical protein PHG82_03560 [Candidatus Gracilibacteria bacterium]|nr:hypothetical protein [Candidatus Gracilibacteria bacterium]
MQKEQIIQKIEESIKNREELSPFLFTGTDLEKLNYDVSQLISDIFTHFGEDKNNLFKISDSSETIKVKDIRTYLERSFIKTNSIFQIFLIENISRLTDESSNAMLKFLEEPGFGNLVFLTNSGENKVLDTILSRVQHTVTGKTLLPVFDEKYYMFLENFYFEKDFYLFSYFYREKLEKDDYILFLQTFIYFIEKNLVLTQYIDLVYNTLNQIISQPVVAKYQVDKILLRLKTKD